jgi:D-hydroxyproline dehydrogenase subunit alpha
VNAALSNDVLNPDVLIVGAGPAGIAASVRARECGARVSVIDDNPALGGQIWRGGVASKSDSEALSWLERFAASKIPILNSAYVISEDRISRTLLIETPEEKLEFSFGKLILATGAREIFLPFPGWTLPGIMGVGGLQALTKSGLPVSGKKVVISGSGPLLLAAAAYLRKIGARVKLIAEQASRAALARFALQLFRSPGKIVQTAGLQRALAGVPYLPGCWVEAAEGNGHVERVRLRRGSRVWMEDCDFAGIGYGLYPNTELAVLLGCSVEETGIAANEFQQSSVENVFCAGECTGIGGLDLSLAEGEIAGYAAAGQMERARQLFRKRTNAQQFAEALNAAFKLREELKRLPRPETFVCRCEDVSFQRLQGVHTFRSAKIQTRCGMGPCQARICGPAVNFLFGWRTESIRPPIYPARLGSLISAKIRSR